MNRKQKLNIIFLIILMIAAFFIIRENRNSTMPLDKDAFTVKDTASISKVFIADRKGKRVSLIKENNIWLINGEYEVNKTRINSMLEVLAKMEIKSPTPESMMEMVVKSMATEAIKVEIYRNKRKPYKTFYVGLPTQDHKGTFMSLDKKNKNPHIVHIPGWYGYLSEGYFFTDIIDWRSKEVFVYDPLQIKEVRIDYMNIPDSSFTLSIDENYHFSLVQNSTKKEVSGVDELKVKSYLHAFTDLYIVDVDKDISEKKRDSIIIAGPFIKIAVTDRTNRVNDLILYYKPTDLKTRVELFEGVDKEHYYGIKSDRIEDMLLIQALQFDRILWKIDDFFN